MTQTMAPLPAWNSAAEGQLHRQNPPSPGERLLVIPFADGIGDFVMMLPLLEAIRRCRPGAAVTVAASQRSRLLLDEDQERAFEVRTPSWLQSEARPRGGPLRKLLPQPALASLAGLALRSELGRFDRTLNLFQWWECGMDFATYWTPQVPPRPGATHSLDHLADRLGKELGQPISPAERRPQARVRAAAAAWAAEWWRAAGLDGRRVVALVPATNMRIKRWPLDCWAQLCRDLTASGATPLLVLPPRDDPAGPALAALPDPPLTVRAPLDRVAALLVRCRLVVSVDTGLLHLSAAVGTRYVGLFGPTNPEVTGPYDRTLGTTLVAGFSRGRACRGCWRQFKYIDDRCPAVSTGSCMNGLPVETVFAACLAELDGGQRLATAAKQAGAGYT